MIAVGVWITTRPSDDDIKDIVSSPTPEPTVNSNNKDKYPFPYSTNELITYDISVVNNLYVYLKNDGLFVFDTNAGKEQLIADTVDYGYEVVDYGNQVPFSIWLESTAAHVLKWNPSETHISFSHSDIGGVRNYIIDYDEAVKEKVNLVELDISQSWFDKNNKSFDVNDVPSNYRRTNSFVKWLNDSEFSVEGVETQVKYQDTQLECYKYSLKGEFLEKIDQEYCE